MQLAISNDARKIQKALEITQNVLEEMVEDIEIDWVKHDGFREYSYIIAMRYIIKDLYKRHEVMTKVNQEIMVRFEKAGIEFTKPPQLS